MGRLAMTSKRDSGVYLVYLALLTCTSCNNHRAMIGHFKAIRSLASISRPRSDPKRGVHTYGEPNLPRFLLHHEYIVQKHDEQRTSPCLGTDSVEPSHDWQIQTQGLCDLRVVASRVVALSSARLYDTYLRGRSRYSVLSLSSWGTPGVDYNKSSYTYFPQHSTIVCQARPYMAAPFGFGAGAFLLVGQLIGKVVAEFREVPTLLSSDCWGKAHTPFRTATQLLNTKIF